MPARRPRPRGALRLALTAAAMVVPSVPVRADERSAARLVYTVDDPDGTCVSESELRRKVAARLGYDPFRPDASWVFRVRFESRGQPRAEIVSEQRGDVPRKRVLDDTTCDSLSETVASTLAIAIDPVAAQPAAPAAPTAATAASPPPVPDVSRASLPPDQAAEPPSPPPEPRTDRTPVEPYLYIDGLVAFGRTAGAALGGRGGFGLRYGALAIGAEGRGEATPGVARLSPLDSAHFSVFSGGLVPCGRIGAFEACGVLAVGSLQARARDVTRPSLKGTLFGSVGARLGAGIPISEAVALRGNAELGIPLVRTTFSIEGEPVWTAPAVQGTLAVGVEVRFR